eukprot:SAG22_NODE_4700_length_1188_cov_1.745638_2_plen_289_part_00
MWQQQQPPPASVPSSSSRPGLEGYLRRQVEGELAAGPAGAAASSFSPQARVESVLSSLREREPPRHGSPGRSTTQQQQQHQHQHQHQQQMINEALVLAPQLEELVGVVAQLRRGLNTEKKVRLALAAELAAVQSQLVNTQQQLELQRTGLAQERAARERLEASHAQDRAKVARSLGTAGGAAGTAGGDRLADRGRLAEVERQSAALERLAAEQAGSRQSWEARLERVEGELAARKSDSAVRPCAVAIAMAAGPAATISVPGQANLEATTKCMRWPLLTDLGFLWHACR